MARILGTERCVLRLLDNLSGSHIEFGYRPPTTKERAAYTNEQVQRRGNRLRTLLGEARQRYGLRILLDIRDGDFMIMDKGKAVPLSCRPGSEGYREDWKDQVLEHASDLVEILAAQVFEGSAMVDEGMGDDAAEAGEDVELD